MLRDCGTGNRKVGKEGEGEGGEEGRRECKRGRGTEREGGRERGTEREGGRERG